MEREEVLISRGEGLSWRLSSWSHDGSGSWFSTSVVLPISAHEVSLPHPPHASCGCWSLVTSGWWRCCCCKRKYSSRWRIVMGWLLSSTLAIMASPGWAHVWDQQGYFKRLLSWDLSRQQLGDLESLARDSALPILRIKAYSDPAEEIEKRFNLLKKRNRIETRWQSSCVSSTQWKSSNQI